ncbi:MAG: helix-turn-helix domain-containing protein [Streptosporangiales bacterium]|nr:helix-turn-helix domain-containing protein [Streptosporangiales bacterium]
MPHVAIPVHPALRPFVASIGYYEGTFGHTRERVLPTGSQQLMVNLTDDVMGTWRPDGPRQIGGAGLVGTATGPVDVDPGHQRQTLFVAFRPGGGRPFVPFPAAESTDELVELQQVWGRAGGVLRERLLAQPTPEAKLEVLAAHLLAHAQRPLQPDPSVGYACAALDRGMAVHEVVDRLGVTPKRLIRTFHEHVGVGPKQFARIRRLQRVLRAVPHDRPVDWAALAVRQGYADQSHLIHEFRDLTGITPGRYRARSPGERNHVVLGRELTRG